jgi:3-hydroxyacyl-[acyl-carrier-protein] dehydratase
MQWQVDNIVSESHPALAGHFPGNAVVPAVIILDRVGGALRAWDENCRLVGISRARFTDVLRPEERFTISLTSADLVRFSFACRKADRSPFAEGELLASRAEH